MRIEIVAHLVTEAIAAAGDHNVHCPTGLMIIVNVGRPIAQPAVGPDLRELLLHTTNHSERIRGQTRLDRQTRLGTARGLRAR